MTNVSKLTTLSTFALVMLITGAVDNIRNLPAAALFGSTLIFFYVFSAIVFLIPTALVSAELSASWPEKSGIYHWVRLAFGERFAFLAIWLQWINNMVWFPTILSFIAGIIAYLINPDLAQNKIYLVTVILASFWFLTLINLKGIHVSANFVSFCTIIGMVIPMALIISLAVAWIMMGKPLQIHITASNMLPSFSHMENWVSLTAIMTAFIGMELAAVHIKDVNNPQKTFPKAIYISVWLILLTMIFGSLAIAFVLPAGEISLVNGVMQAFTSFFAAYHIKWFIPVIAVMMLFGTSGGVISWVIALARGLLQAAQLGYLPKFFSKENKHGVAANLLITQAVFVSVICLAFLLMPSVSGSYWLLTALSTELSMIMYALMFFASLRIRHKFPEQPRPFTIPGGKIGMWIVCLLGLVGCIITFIVGFFPPTGINFGSTLRYQMMFTGGIIVMILPILFFYAYKSKTQKQVSRSVVSAEASSLGKTL